MRKILKTVAVLTLGFLAVVVAAIPGYCLDLAIKGGHWGCLVSMLLGMPIGGFIGLILLRIWLPES